MATKKQTALDVILGDRAKAVFNAIVAGEGDVFALHNGENVQLKTVAVADGKLVGIVSSSARGGGVKTIDISYDEVIRVKTEVILEQTAEAEFDDETEE